VNMEIISDEQLTEFLATIYGEAAQSTLAAWRAIASSILNRVGRREWRKYKTPLAIIANTGYDAFTERNQPYTHAKRYFQTQAPHDDPRLKELAAVVTPIYMGWLYGAILPPHDRIPPPFPTIQLYYSPKAQHRLHEQRPDLYHAYPKWHFDELVEVRVPGAEGDDFKFFAYKTGPGDVA